MKKISIIIPCYRQAQYLSEAIESCLAQSITPHEIIVVNDGGEKFEVPDYCILIEQENRGLSGARNTGIKNATGDYIICLDADDTLPPDYLEQLSKIDADIVGCGYKTFGDYESEWKTRGTITVDDLLDGNRTQCSALFKREIFDKVQFDENMKHGQEDHLFWLEAVLHGYKMVTTDKTWLNYRKHGASMVSENPKYSKENARYIAEKLVKVFGVDKIQV